MRKTMAQTGLIYLRILILLLAAFGAIAALAMQLGLLFPGPLIPRQAAELPSDGDSIVVEGGRKRLWSGFIPVDTSQTYRLSGRFRVLPASDGSPAPSTILFGVAAFDGNRERLITGSAYLRYVGANLVVLNSLQNWVNLYGSITSEGDGSHNLFIPGTRFIRVYVSVNTFEEDSAVEIRDIEFTQLLEVSG